MTESRNYPNYLFESNPPVEDQWVGALFCNRESELRTGLTLLRSPVSLPKVHVVHGLRRSGKSHLVHKLLLQAETEQLPYQIFKVNANSQGTARAVLDDLFFQLQNRIEQLEEHHVPIDAVSLLLQSKAYLSDVCPLIAHESHDISFERTSSALDSIGAEARLGAPNLPGFQVAISGRVEMKDETKKRWSQQGPSDRDMVEYLRYEIDAFAAFFPGKRVLLFIDDLDLLDTVPGDGHRESDALLALLRPLAECRNGIILASIRQLFFNGREKDFKDFLKVGLLSHTLLRQIYLRHIECFNAGEEVFTPEALDWLIRSADGKVGMFLHRCMEFWRRFSPSAGQRIGISELKVFIKEELEELRQDSEHLKVLIPITAAVRNGQSEVEITDDLSQSGLLYRILTPLLYRSNAYSINTLYSDVIRQEAI